MRHPRELAFRLGQEFVNLRLLVARPKWNGQAQGIAPGVLPDPASIVSRLSETEFPEEVEQLAAQILAHHFPLLGTSIETGPDVRWRRDHVNEKETAFPYFRLVPYLDVKKCGDHKWIWELNRHQHLVLLAQAYQFRPKEEYIAEIGNQLESWWQQNPFQRGINWASTLEVGFRAVSWIWILHLVGPALPRSIRQKLEQSLHLHGLHLQNNLSFYFSPNTHLLGEAVALHAIGRCLPHLPRSNEWTELGRNVVEDQMREQVHDDGSHFEHSTYYHVYALDMFLFHAILGLPSPQYLTKLGRMADYLDALLGADRKLPYLGDDDGGRWFYPYGNREVFGCVTIATCSEYLQSNYWTVAKKDYYAQACWWLACQPRSSPSNGTKSALFPDAGVAVLRSDSSKIVIDYRAFGRGSAGHSHAGALNLIITAEGEELLIDPGTFTYVANTALRDEFRGTAAHNTVRVDGVDQADSVNPFRWANHPNARILSWSTSASEDILQAECRYRGLIHKRYFHFVKPLALLIVDEVTGPPGEHLIEQFWRLGSGSVAARLKLSGAVETSQGWRSRCFSQKELAPVLCVRMQTKLPVRLAAAIQIHRNADIAIKRSERNTRFTITSPGGTDTIDFNEFSS
jgi:hypothetical protein